LLEQAALAHQEADASDAAAHNVVVENGEIRRPVEGKTLYVAPQYDRSVESHIADWFEEAYSVRFSNYAVGESYLSR